ncbi:MAG TPA: SBBP repeat-containing protein [Acidimicrobiia bacterium]|jgi:hypothetical protein|nr:SBBP repeat-containing protein [Acidimicrobiia bacterium]
MLAMRSAALAVVVFLLNAPASPATDSEPHGWVRQFGTSGLDEAKSVAVDPTGAIYTVGETFGALPGQTPAGTLDAFIRKYDPSGTEVWTRQFGAWDRDIAWAVAASPAGAVYVVGQTEGTLPGQHSAGGLDAFIRRYDPSGTEVWTRQFGGGGADVASAVAVDQVGNIFVSGTTSSSLAEGVQPKSFDAFVRRYDEAGHEGWTRQFGTEGGDNARDVTVDQANRLLVAGSTEGTLPGQVSSKGFDAFVASFDRDGRTLWICQFGSTGDDFGVAVAADGEGNVFVAGTAGEALSGRPSPGGRTAFLTQFDQTGVALWTDQFDTGGADDAWDVAVAGEGTAYLVGATQRALPGQRAAGRIDAFVRQYGPGGREIWTRQYGTPEDDYALAVALDHDRGLVIAGSTRGTLDDRAHGNLDAYALRLPGSSNP